jgi:hypothetical protein
MIERSRSKFSSDPATAGALIKIADTTRTVWMMFRVMMGFLSK